MENRLPNKVIYSYGFAYLTFTLFTMFLTGNFALYLSDVMMITAAHVGVITSATMIVNIVIVLLSGIIIQRTRMRWGQYRSWFIFMPAVACLFIILLFTNLPMSYSFKIAWTVTTFILANMGISFLFTAHLSFISVSKNATERLWLSARNTQFGVVSQIIFAAAITPAAAYFISGYGKWGYLYTALILTVLMLMGYWNLFHQSRKYEIYDSELNKPSNKMSIADLFTQTFGNSQLLLLMTADCMVFFGSGVVAVLSVYYYKYVAGGDVGTNFMVFTLPFIALISYLIAPYIIIKSGKKKVYLFLISLSILCLIYLRIFGDSSPHTFKVIFYFGGILTGLLALMRQALYMDISEFGFYKTGKDVTAYIMSVHRIAPTIGVSLAASAAAFGLHILKYSPNMAITDDFINGLMNMICYIPITCGVIAIVAMSFYSLTGDKVEEIMEANSLKKYWVPLSSRGMTILAGRHSPAWESSNGISKHSLSAYYKKGAREF